MPINFVKLERNDNHIWLMSIRDKTFGEMQALKQLQQQMREHDLNINWLILDIVDANRESILQAIAQKEKLSDGQTTITQQDAETQQLELENYVRNLIRNSGFGNPILKPYREQIKQLLVGDIYDNNLIETVKIGLKFRYIDSPLGVKENRYQIADSDVRNGYVTIGATDTKVEEILGQHWLGENMLRDIFNFLTAEYAGENFLTTTATPTPAPEDSEDSEDDGVEKKPVLL